MMEQNGTTMATRARAGMATRAVLLLVAALMAVLSVAAVGARDAQAALTDSQQRSVMVQNAYRILNAHTVKYTYAFGNPCSEYQADCECFNRLVAKKAGIYLKSTLYGQISQGRWTSNPQPGDLVFFDRNRNGNWGNDNDHTGVYVGKNSAGQPMVIHAIDYPRGNGTVYKQTVAQAAQYNGPAKYLNVVSYN